MLIAIIIAILLIDVWLFASDRYIWSFTLLVASTAAAFYFIPEVAAFVAAYGWFEVIKYGVPGYFLLGAATASLKWISFTRGVADRITSLREEFDQSYRVPRVEVNRRRDPDPLRDPNRLQGGRPSDDELVPLEGVALVQDRRKSFLKQVAQSSQYIFKRPHGFPHESDIDYTNDEVFIGLLTPRTRNYMDRVSFWVLQWPIVLISFILEDLIIKLANHIARLIDTVFNRLARMFVGNAVKGL